MKSLDQSIQYQICLEGKLDDRWLRWFEGLEVKTSEENQTVICGEFDQSALHGLFTRIRDLGITINSVQRDPEKHISNHSKKEILK